MTSTATRRFLDTNVLVYAADASEPAKQRAAIEVLADPNAHRVVSTQVLIEFYSAATRKIGIEPSAASRMVEELAMLEVVPASAELVLRAVDLARAHQLSIWDAMIVEAAAQANCAEILTEDLSSGSSLRGVRVMNPFV